MTAGATALALASTVAHEAAAECRFAPERPGATNAPSSVGQGCGMIESSFQVDRSAPSTALSMPTLMRLGVIDPLELRLGSSLSLVDAPDDGDAEAGKVPLALEAKLMAREAADQLPGTGVLIGASTPTDGRSDEHSAYLTMLFDWELTTGLWWSVNGTASTVKGEASDSRFMGLGYATVLWLDKPLPGQWLSMFWDATGGSTLESGSPWQQSVGAGLAFHLSERLQLDTFVSVGVSEDPLPVTAAFGVAWQPQPR
jgi:hypothetical protein